MSGTLHLEADRPADVARAAEILRAGGLVAFPTETVYGLGANALAGEAVARIFEAKGRPAWDPLIVHLPMPDRIGEVAKVEGMLEARVRLLAEAFWPGPLTMLLPRARGIPDAVTAGRPLVGLRVPAHPAAQALLRAAGVPVAAPSANRFGHTSPTTAQHVLDDLGGRIEAVLDAGPSRVGVESTVLDPGQTPMVLYRAGAVTPEEILERTGVAVEVFTPGERAGEREALPSPGVGLRHYAPEARVELTAGTFEALLEAVLAAREGGERVGVLLPSDWPAVAADGVEAVRWGVWRDAASLAAGLFAGLRALEQRGVGVVVCPLPEGGGMGDALRDRLVKAAKPR